MSLVWCDGPGDDTRLTRWATRLVLRLRAWCGRRRANVLNALSNRDC